MSDPHGGQLTGGSLLFAFLFLVLLGGYVVAVAAGSAKGRGWPRRRTLAWCAGLGAAASVVLGPFAGVARHDFTVHVGGHLVWAMAAPVLLALAAPVTVVLRALPAGDARRLSRLLHSPPARLLSHPLPVAALNVGGMWVLYTTDLYPAMHSHEPVQVVVHLHMLIIGYLFAAALIGVDPSPHRPGFGIRATALVAVAAAHGVLAKYLYAHPPSGVPTAQAESGALLLYYGGDVLGLPLLILVCLRWYRAARPGRRPVGPARERVSIGSDEPFVTRTFG